MKRHLIIFLIAVGLAVATGVGISYYRENQTIVLGSYRGEPITKIGNDPVVKQFSAEILEHRKNQLSELAMKLGKNPESVELWMNVGLVKKFFNNYKGAVQAYEHAARLEPANPLIYYNLGNLYGAYLKDYPKAEAMFLKAREVGQGLDYTHLGLAGFYHDFYTEKFDQIEPVLLAGLKQLPRDANLILNLALYYKEKGRNTEAITYFRKLLNHEDVSGLQKQQITDEIKALQAQ